MNIDEAINGWTYEETVKTAESLMEVEKNMFKWDVIRHLRDFAETYREQLKEYQQLEEQGRIIKLPCKIGDKVWHISGMAIKEDVISGIEYSYDGMFYIWSNEDTWLGGLNDIVFLTKSEAEAKLKELRGENE